jgi:hypothetical protein
MFQYSFEYLSSKQIMCLWSWRSASYHVRMSMSSVHHIVFDWVYTCYYEDMFICKIILVGRLFLQKFCQFVTRVLFSQATHSLDFNYPRHPTPRCDLRASLPKWCWQLVACAAHFRIKDNFSLHVHQRGSWDQRKKVCVLSVLSDGIVVIIVWFCVFSHAVASHLPM